MSLDMEHMESTRKRLGKKSKKDQDCRSACADGGIGGIGASGDCLRLPKRS